ncbi:DUF2612 domain-containing protein [Bosea sp. UC22_33]|uniref:DUF2612 domain-containing protein n=1 Tax=Bosea sp. UC22_33 TaxID=3350165 RepID=UPI00366A5737
MTERVCPVQGELVEEELNKVATEYREATKFLGLIRALLSQPEDAAIKLCAVPSFFDIDTAVGDQLTILGKQLGFQRCHCICDAPKVFGFKCGPFASSDRIAGFCEPGSTWAGCPPLGASEVCITDDEVFRGFVKARRYQVLGLYDIASLQSAARHLWGNAASVISSRVGRVTLAPGRVLSDFEMALVPVAFRVLPIAPGIKGSVHYGTGPIFGFGEGWGGFCESAEFICPSDPHTYTCV